MGMVASFLGEGWGGGENVELVNSWVTEAEGRGGVKEKRNRRKEGRNWHNQTSKKGRKRKVHR